MKEILDDYINGKYYGIIMLGDLNMPNINWPVFEGMTNICENVLCDHLQSCNITQVNIFPSRKNNANILDVILTDVSHIIMSVQCVKSIIESDHFQINIKLKINCKVSYQVPREVYNWHKADYDKLSEYLLNCNLVNVVYKI